MNEYIELMERTLSEWVKEYPIEWIEQAYKNTVGGPTTKNDLGVDSIDRTELLKAMDTWDKFGYSARYGLERLDKDDKGFVPYVKYDDMVNCVKGMPPLTPQEPKTGHWGWLRCDMYVCSECKNVYTDLSGIKDGMNYCPNCGSRNEVKEC